MKTLNKIIAGGSLALISMSIQADIVHLNDVIIDGSQCIGTNCVDGESFGLDTIRLKEAILRIKFEDTSTISNFPSNDWQIIINDDFIGGQNKFSIEDIDSDRTPFTIEAGAGNHSLYVDEAGRVGLGTSIPDAKLHLVDGDTPIMRLEQDSSSNFPSQTWEVAGNDLNFFIRDVTNNGSFIFRIRPGAPNNSILIDTNGDVGMGTGAPTSSLHIRRDTGSAKILVEETNITQGPRTLFEIKNKGNPEFRMTNSGNGNSWLFSAGLRFVVKNNAGDWVSRVDANGNMEITGALTTAGGTCGGGGCDLLFHPDTKIESIEDHAASMWANSHLPAVGPTVENKPFNITEKTGGMLNELEKAHVYIEQLHNRLAKQNQQLQSSEERINKLEAEQNLKITALRAEQTELKNAVMLLIRQKDNPILLTAN